MRELWLQNESVQHINNGKLSANLFPKEDINFEYGKVFTVFVNRLQNVDTSLLPLSGQWFELRKWRPNALLFESVEVRRIRVWWDTCLRGGGGQSCHCLGLSQHWWRQWPTLGATKVSLSFLCSGPEPRRPLCTALGIFLSSMPVSSCFTDEEGEACVSQSRWAERDLGLEQWVTSAGALRPVPGPD